MSHIALVLSLLCATVLAFTVDNKPVYLPEDAQNLFEEFITTYQKQYTDEEKARRFEIFKNSLEEVNQLNREQKLAVFGITQFSDLTLQEFKQKYTGLIPNYNSSEATMLTAKGIEVPDSFDWRSQNVVSPVKDQGICGSCWSFSATGAIESAYAIKHQQLYSLSEQQLLDCDTTDSGCNGGMAARAMQYVQQAGGIVQESSYPYADAKGSCQFNKDNVVVRISSYQQMQPQSEDAMVEQVLQQPLSIGIYSGTLHQYYQGGVMTSNCPSNQPDHAVLLVGYGTESGSGVPFWIIKNSWGLKFGEDGYFRIQRGVNLCGILYGQIAIPTVE